MHRKKMVCIDFMCVSTHNKKASRFFVQCDLISDLSIDFSDCFNNCFFFVISVFVWFCNKWKKKSVKKAYYRLSLQIHPDRVAEAEKEEATEKFKVLTKINAVLTDSSKKELYDTQGIIDDDGEADCNWVKLWREFFKPITKTDIEKFHQEYIGEFIFGNCLVWCGFIETIDFNTFNRSFVSHSNLNFEILNCWKFWIVKMLNC